MDKEKRKDLLKKRNSIWRAARLAQKEKNHKTSEVHFRCTKNEHAFIKLKAHELDPNKTITEYILECSLFNVINKVDLESINELTTSINRLGNNINQITRQLNTAAKNDGINQSTIDDAIKHLESYKLQLEELSSLSARYISKLNMSLAYKEPNCYDNEVDYTKELEEITNKH